MALCLLTASKFSDLVEEHKPVLTSHTLIAAFYYTQKSSLEQEFKVTFYTWNERFTFLKVSKGFDSNNNTLK